MTSNSTTKIIIADILSFREDLNTSWEVIQKEGQPVRQAILNRFRTTEDLIGQTTDINELQKLDADRKFLKSIATHLDAIDLYVARMTSAFNRIDDTYWAGVLDSTRMIGEIAQMKDQVRSLKIHKFILETGLKKELRKKSLLRDKDVHLTSNPASC